MADPQDPESKTGRHPVSRSPMRRAIVVGFLGTMKRLIEAPGPWAEVDA